MSIQFYHIYIYMVDNASSDATSREAENIGRELFGSRFHYIRNQENLGFAVACNQGARAAADSYCDYLVFLNNDTLVTPSWLELLQAELDDARVGLAGPLLLYPDDTIQHCGVVYNLNGHLKHIYQKFPKNHRVIGNQQIFKAITGAVLMARTEEFFSIGPFCEEYRNGFEDVDLCYRYGERGFVCKVSKHSRVYHLESKSPGRLNKEQLEHNQSVFLKRNKFMKPDAHIYYENDGYLPALMKDYFFYVRLTEEKRQEFLYKVKASYSDKLCYTMLMNEPYWHDGYFLLFDSFYKQKLYENALECCSMAFNFGFLFDEVYDRFLACSKKFVNSEDFQNISTWLNEEKEERVQIGKANQVRLKNSVVEEWRKKMFLTRKLSVC